MRPEGAKEVFLQRLQEAGHSLDGLRPADGIALMLDFYADERAEGCALEQDGDMLLFQWGTYTQTYKEQRGEWFDFDITRQFIFGGPANIHEWNGEDETDPELLQLSLTFKFKASDALKSLGNNNEWCASLDELLHFREFVLQSPAYAAVGHMICTDVGLTFGSAE